VSPHTKHININWLVLVKIVVKQFNDLNKALISLHASSPFFIIFHHKLSF